MHINSHHIYSTVPCVFVSVYVKDMSVFSSPMIVAVHEFAGATLFAIK